jgi:predicted PurR-regulated permease PerM
MNPIISPLTIYLINLMEPLHAVFIGACIVFLVLGILNGIDYLDNKDSSTEKYQKQAQKALGRTRRMAVICVLCMLLAVFVPSKNTIIEMIVAQNITVNNINAGEEKVKEAIDYLVEKVKEVNE